MAEVMIRSAIIEDLETIIPLINQLGYPASLLEMRRRLKVILEEPKRQQILVALRDDEIVGLIHLQCRATLLSDYTVEIVSLVVAESYRSHGVGKRLLEKADEWARQLNISSIMLYSNCKRERAHQFYYRNGYSKIKDSVMLQKKLAAMEVRSSS